MDAETLATFAMAFGRAETAPAPRRGAVVLAHDPGVPDVLDLARVTRLAYGGGDLGPLIEAQTLLARHEDVAAQMNLATLYQLVGRREDGLRCQASALERQVFYRVPAEGRPSLRVLAFVAPGDLKTNLPFEFLLEGQGIEVIKFYVAADAVLPARVPAHDLALVAIGEGDHTADALRLVAGWRADWPCPVVNDADAVFRTGRGALHRLLRGAPGIESPVSVRAGRDALIAGRLPEGLAYPLVVRPANTHAGEGLERVGDAAALQFYLLCRDEAEYDLSPFVDYAGADGKWRKYRVAFVGGRAALCHMAIGDEWMVHYLNAGMMESEAKRQEEAAMFAAFDDGFARRHGEAFRALHERLGLDYFTIDCAETHDGRLLVFEASVAMIVHALDPEVIFPAKPPAMRRLFGTFAAMLAEKAGRG